MTKDKDGATVDSSDDDDEEEEEEDDEEESPSGGGSSRSSANTAATAGTKQGAKKLGLFRRMAMKAESKLVQNLASKPSVVNAALDEDTAELLDGVYRFAKRERSREHAKKLRTHMIKVVVKLAFLGKNDLLTKENQQSLTTLRTKLKAVMNTVVTFHDTPFTFDAEYLHASLEECRALCRVVVQQHLTERSVGRVDFVFDYLADMDVLKKLFTDKQYESEQNRIAAASKNLLDKKVI